MPVVRMVLLVVAAALVLAIQTSAQEAGSGGAGVQQGEDEVVIDLGGAEVAVDAEQPLVACIVAGTTTISETVTESFENRTVKLVVHVRGVNGQFTELGSFVTEKNGPLTNLAVRDCPYLEGGE